MSGPGKSFAAWRRQAVVDGLAEALVEQAGPSVRRLDAAYRVTMLGLGNDQRELPARRAAGRRRYWVTTLVQPSVRWTELLVEIRSSLEAPEADLVGDRAWDRDYQGQQAVLAVATFLRAFAGELQDAAEELADVDDGSSADQVTTLTSEAYEVSLSLLRRVEDETWPDLVDVHRQGEGLTPDNVLQLPQFQAAVDNLQRKTAAILDTSALLNTVPHFVASAGLFSQMAGGALDQVRHVLQNSMPAMRNVFDLHQRLASSRALDFHMGAASRPQKLEALVMDSGRMRAWLAEDRGRSELFRATRKRCRCVVPAKSVVDLRGRNCLERTSVSADLGFDVRVRNHRFCGPVRSFPNPEMPVPVALDEEEMADVWLILVYQAATSSMALSLTLPTKLWWDAKVRAFRDAVFDLEMSDADFAGRGGVCDIDLSSPLVGALER